MAVHQSICLCLFDVSSHPSDVEVEIAERTGVCECRKGCRPFIDFPWSIRCLVLLLGVLGSDETGSQNIQLKDHYADDVGFGTLRRSRLHGLWLEHPCRKREEKRRDCALCSTASSSDAAPEVV
jgi:hypothetical protein